MVWITFTWSYICTTHLTRSWTKLILRKISNLCFLCMLTQASSLAAFLLQTWFSAWRLPYTRLCTTQWGLASDQYTITLMYTREQRHIIVTTSNSSPFSPHARTHTHRLVYIGKLISVVCLTIQLINAHMYLHTHFCPATCGLWELLVFLNVSMYV